MACSCKGKKSTKYVWTDGTNTVIYNTEIEAKAKVLRKGGTYSAQGA
jgi:hypothetical protein